MVAVGQPTALFHEVCHQGFVPGDGMEGRRKSLSILYDRAQPEEDSTSCLSDPSLPVVVVTVVIDMSMAVCVVPDAVVAVEAVVVPLVVLVASSISKTYTEP